MSEDIRDFYKNKIFAGPMVRASNLPFRLMCLENGADACYGPATSCDSILISHMEENDPYKLWFGWPDNPHIHIHSSPKEKGKFIFQILSSDPVKAVKAAEVVLKFSDAIDLNCGCPENFATSRGTGSAMMNDPQLVTEIISALRSNYSCPISVKHRILPDIEKSIQFAVACQNAGATAVAVHGRLKDQRNKGSVAYDDMRIVFDNLSVTKIGNGGVKNLDMAQKMKEETGCDSVIISSAALKNPTIFSQRPEKNPLITTRRYLEIAAENDCYDRHEWRWSASNMLGKYRHVTKNPDYELFGKIEELNEARAFLARDGVFPMPASEDDN